MREGHLGYINKYGYSSIEPYEVFKKDGKLFAVKIEKVQVCEPKSTPGSFSAYCINQEEDQSSEETREVGDPFELERKYGFYGYTISKTCLMQTFSTKTEAEKAKCSAEALVSQARKDYSKIDAREFEICPIYDKNGDATGWYSLTGYLLTKAGRRQRQFIRLGTKIVDNCRFSYGYSYSF